MEQGRGQDGEQPAELQDRIREGSQGPTSRAAASAGEGVSPSFGSANMSQRASESSDLAERDYVKAVLDCYRSLPATPGFTSRHDRKCAKALFRRGVPLDLVESAMVVAVARRTFRRRDSLARIRAFHFFLPVIEELVEVPCESGYVQYVKNKLEAVAGHEIPLHRGEAVQPESCRVGRGSSPLLREAPSSRGR